LIYINSGAAAKHARAAVSATGAVHLRLKDASR
jgi:hypothetical protein